MARWSRVGESVRVLGWVWRLVLDFEFVIVMIESVGH